jgi:hypothetical protein
MSNPTAAADRDARAEQARAESLARQDRDRAAYDRRAAERQREHEAFAQAVRDAAADVKAAKGRADKAAREQADERKKFNAAHERRRDPALARLDRDLGRAADERDALAKRIAEQVSGAFERASVNQLAQLLALDQLAQPEAPERVRELVGDAEVFSPLSSEQRDARLSAAAPHREQLDIALREAREQERIVNAALTSLRDGQRVKGDPAAAAVAATGAAERAEQSLASYRAALADEDRTPTTTKET